MLASGRDMVFDIDWQGHRQMRSAMPADVVGLFILPPSLAVLEQRLRGRESDSDDEIALRMRKARDEISHWDEFDHVLVNDQLDRAIAQARSVLHAARLAVSRQPGPAASIVGWGAGS